MFYCGLCKILACKTVDKEKYPKNCPCRSNIIDESRELYYSEENKIIAYNSAIVEKEGYCKETRIEETINFVKRSNYRKIGIAFCSGLKKEVEAINNIYIKKGFEVYSVICQCGNIPKEYIGITEEQKINPDKFETMCNPIGQALLLNECETDFNIVVGLCVGHDSLFIKYSKAPVTVLAVKDRVTGHNPLAPIYLRSSYYKSKLEKID